VFRFPTFCACCASSAESVFETSSPTLWRASQRIVGPPAASASANAVSPAIAIRNEM
jgi:hypothetical protein